MATLILYFALCAFVLMRERRRRLAVQQRSESLLPAADGAPPLLVIHASQTGTSEQLAWQTAQSLQLAGVATQVLTLGEVRPAALQSAGRALFIVSTYGEGDPPDAAAPFVRAAMLQTVGESSLDRLHYGVLALGDSTYANFCGFGRALDQWLLERGGTRLFARIDADRVAESAVDAWRHQLAHIAGTRDAPDWSAPEFQPWVLSARTLMNPGSDGEPACHLELRPGGNAPLPHWQAGDLLQLRVQGSELPREYSIASLPSDGSVHLLVRQARRDDGSPGAASGWLVAGAAIGATLAARIREHRGFRLGENAARPLLLIGNGTGIAGLRALLKARAALNPSGPAHRCWLVFGERSARHDAFYVQDLARWQASGLLQRCDLVYSRDQPQRRYVQHLLDENQDALRAWIAAGAAIYVCGSLKGMASEVDAVLARALGRDQLDGLAAAGRYRRDVY